MTNRTAQVTCAGKVFVIEKFSAVDALKRKGRILKVAAPILGKLDELQGLEGFKAGADVAMLSELLEDVIGKLDTDATTDLIVELCKTARYGSGDKQGGFVDFNEAFLDDLTPAYLLTFEILKFNYQNYFLKMSQGTAEQKETTDASS